MLFSYSNADIKTAPGRIIPGAEFISFNFLSASMARVNMTCRPRDESLPWGKLHLLELGDYFLGRFDQHVGLFVGQPPASKPVHLSNKGIQIYFGY